MLLVKNISSNYTIYCLIFDYISYIGIIIDFVYVAYAVNNKLRTGKGTGRATTMAETHLNYNQVRNQRIQTLPRTILRYNVVVRICSCERK